MADITLRRSRHVPLELSRLLPPRREWPRLGQQQRRSSSTDPLRSRAELLAWYVLKALRNRSKKDSMWLRRLRAFIENVRSSALNWSTDVQMSPRQTIGIPKSRHGSRQKYRLVSIYGIRETVLASGFAAFLRNRLEPHLGEECLAYRAAKPNSPPPTHHDAIVKILNYATTQGANRPIWVAECDLIGFFDNLKHSVVRSAVKGILRPDLNDDKNARAFIDSFLKGYSFSKGYDEALGRLKSLGVSAPDFGRKLQDGDSITGIAQGSAVSSVLANAVLFRADREVSKISKMCSGLYLRYSDDTIFISPDRKKCADMLYTYLSEVERIGLPYHRPAKTPAYGKIFWSGKSKAPYKWSLDGRRQSVPWVSFVGYHVRRDLEVRARPSSIEKERAKQLRVTDLITARLTSAVARRKNKSKPLMIRPVPAIVFRAMQHMLAFSVGRVHQWKPMPIADSLCWIRGFKMLKGSRAARFGLIRLDRSRNLALLRLAGKLKGLLSSKMVEEGRTNVNRKYPFVLRRPGRPFSYYWQFL